MKLGIALAGGGVKGAAHIGVIKALEENGIKIDMIGGTSAGSMVAVLYALGYSPAEILKLFNYFSKMILKGGSTYIQPGGKKALSIQMGGFISGESISAAIKDAARYKQKKTIDEIEMPIAIPTVDVDEAEKYVFTNQVRSEKRYIQKAPIEMAVRASSSYPRSVCTLPLWKS